MKKMILAVLLCLGILQLQAQEIYNSSGKAGKARYKENVQQKGFDPHKLVFGGGLGLSFGTITYISATPVVGYRITDNFTAGISLGYTYYNQKDYFKAPNSISKSRDYSQSIYSGSIWGRYFVIENFFTQAEFELNNISYYNYYFDQQGQAIYSKFRLTIPSLLLGIGYRFPIDENGHSYLFTAISYDVLQDIPSNTREGSNGEKFSLSPYANIPVIRAGFAIGI